MIIEVHPWKLDVDIEGTKNFYKDNDYSLNKEWNRNFVNGLNKCQKEFFENLKYRKQWRILIPLGVYFFFVLLSSPLHCFNQNGSIIFLFTLTEEVYFTRHFACCDSIFHKLIYLVVPYHIESRLLVRLLVFLIS